MKTIRAVTASDEFNDGKSTRTYGTGKPKACPCGNRNLELVETHPAGANYPARVAIFCPLCRTEGDDTCHGLEHAARRWNWHTGNNTGE